MAITSSLTIGSQPYRSVFKSSGTWTVPSGVKNAKVTCVGAGGGWTQGAIAEALVDLTPYSGQTLSITIGAAREPQTNTNEGGATIFGNNLIIATGGMGQGDSNNRYSGMALQNTGTWGFQFIADSPYQSTTMNMNGEANGNISWYNNQTQYLNWKSGGNAPFGSSATASVGSNSVNNNARVLSDGNHYLMGSNASLNTPTWVQINSSTGAATFFNPSTMSSQVATDIAYNGSIFLYFNNILTTAYSSSTTFGGGLTARTAPANLQQTKCVWFSSAGLFVLIPDGTATTTTYYTSTDGINWTPRTFGNAQTSALAILNNRVYRFTASGTTQYSTDGINWTNTSLTSGAWCGTFVNNTYLFVSISQASILTSTDGINFSTAYTYSGTGNFLTNQSSVGLCKWGAIFWHSYRGYLLYSPYTVLTSANYTTSGNFVGGWYSLGGINNSYPIWTNPSLYSAPSAQSYWSLRPGAIGADGLCIVEWVA